jgi:hypothetical protein
MRKVLGLWPLANPFAAPRRIVAASVLLALLCRCGGAVEEGASGNAMHTATDLQKMKFLLGFRNALGQPCRMVEQSIVVNGQKTDATSTMCQQPDGRWVLDGAH